MENSSLRNRRDQTFFVEIGIWVEKLNRQVEFFSLKRQLDEWIDNRKTTRNVESWSCEDWCFEIRSVFRNCVFVEVSIQGGNGARVEEEYVPA